MKDPLEFPESVDTLASLVQMVYLANLALQVLLEKVAFLDVPVTMDHPVIQHS